jgi:hypothetical protein
MPAAPADEARPGALPGAIELGADLRWKAIGAVRHARRAGACIARNGA